ncbi:MAG: methyltransferase domain-containing protein [Pyrinomonadaceae bacterium]|nr:methyltransferase domain-containing protein [Pyrinomonadaceae bacterium]
MEQNNAYDKLPYSNNILPQTHPDVLSSFASLQGLTPPDIQKSRILELGCGNGLNLICHAADLPESEFIGIDLAENHIEKAKATAKRFAVGNVNFHQKDLMKLSESDFGKFDYIIAHGLISWVPQAVRDKTFSIFSKLLSENGIGYLSYNTYPVWHYVQMLRNIGRLHARDITDSTEAAESAMTFLDLLTECVPPDTIYKSILKQETDFMKQLPKTSAVHDMFGEINEAFYFVDFVSELKKNGLKFAAEVENLSTRFNSLPPRAFEFIDAIDDVIWREQYLDFFVGRAFRQTLVCHEEIETGYLVEPSAFENFFLASSLRPVSKEPELQTQKPEKFLGAQGRVIESAHPLTKTALYELGNRWGNTVHYSKLLNDSREALTKFGFPAEDWTKEFEAARSLLLTVHMQTDLLEVHTYQKEVDTSVGKKPAVKKLARMAVEEADFVLLEYNRGMRIEDPLLRKLLELADGSRTMDEIESELVSFVKSSDEIEDKERVIGNLSIKAEIDRFAYLGLFSG